jgi:predicted MPP superfamily phosphohydrolase
LIGALAGINYFVHRRVRTTLSLGPRAQRALAGLLAGSLIAVVAARVLKRALPSAALEAVAVFGTTVQLGALLTAILLFVMLLPGAVRSLVRRLEGVAPRDGDAPADPRRRELLGRAAAGAAIAVGGGASAYAALVGRHDYVVETVPIRLEKLPKTLDGFTLVQLSDIHVGPFVGERELDAAVELVAAAGPDHVVLTGDLVDHDPRDAELLGALVRRLSEIAPVSAVPGNHDYYAGIEQVTRALRRAGAEVLVNRADVIGEGRIVLAGVDDLWARRRGGPGPDLARALAGTPPDAARILLAHQPAYFAESAGTVDFQLSGHTHGGQINPGGPARLVLPYGWVAGRYERTGSQLYVNRGFGTAGPPARLAAPPEVSRFVLCA